MAMPDPRSRVVCRLRDHVTGVNWRPTLFAEVVHVNRICAVCHTIPKRTVLLPCSHSLCEPCLEGSAQDGGGVCPLDRDAFAAEECIWNPYPSRKAEALKAHCWNQPHGCEFVATMDAVLRHYEAECAFHTVECQQCGVAVLHNQLATHCVAGCSGGTPLPTADDGGMPTMRDVRAAVEELKAVVRDPHYDQLPALQSQMNQIMEQCRQDAARVMETMRLLTQSTDNIKMEMTRIASGATLTAAEGRCCQARSGDEASVDSCGVGSCGPSIPWSTEKMLILRRLEVFAKHSQNSMEELRRSFQPGTRPTLISELRASPLTMIEEMKDAETLTSHSSSGLCYALTLRSVHEVFTSANENGWKKRAQLILWDRRDRYLKVTLATGRYNKDIRLYLSSECFCVLPSTRLPTGPRSATVVHADFQNNRQMNVFPLPLPSDPLYSRCDFWTELEPLKDLGFIRDGQLHFLLTWND